MMRANHDMPEGIYTAPMATELINDVKILYKAAVAINAPDSAEPGVVAKLPVKDALLNPWRHGGS